MAEDAPLKVPTSLRVKAGCFKKNKGSEGLDEGLDEGMSEPNGGEILQLFHPDASSAKYL